MNVNNFVIFVSIMLGVMVRSVMTLFLFLGAGEAHTAWIHWGLLILGGMTFANTIRQAITVWQNMQQTTD